MQAELQILRGDLLDTLARVDRLIERTRETVTPITTFAYRHWDAITPNVPEGYDTILGYLAKHHADVLDQLTYSDPRVTVRDGYKLAHLARKANVPVIYVPAPECLSSQGFKTVRAYPLEILEQRWT